jgi:hypothetical protein
MYVVCMSVGACVKLLLRVYKPFAFSFLIGNDNSMSMYVMLFVILHLNVYVSQFLIVTITGSRLGA